MSKEMSFMKRKKRRYFEPLNNKDEYSPVELDIEWESWLRNKRENPPSKEEIKNRINETLIIKKRVELLNKKQIKKENESQGSFPKYSDFK
ncbi:unnamed protein product [Gordionus sp. m RMFG-2023]|uniref:NADH dehydrogenase [ubiquinone] 1 alpha subcomplex assembly factor 2-like isoform X2 n=1 Tax=Gordionus sp. m RMFG-2023 TaxID=3053472 RepID=UPI0030DE867D